MEGRGGEQQGRERERDREMRGERGKGRRKKLRKGKEQNCGSRVLPGSFVNTLQTVFVVEYFLRVRNCLCMTSILCGLCVCVYKLYSCAVFIYRLCLW